MKGLISGPNGMTRADLCRELREQGYSVLVTDMEEMAGGGQRQVWLAYLIEVKARLCDQT